MTYAELIRSVAVDTTQVQTDLDALSKLKSDYDTATAAAVTQLTADQSKLSLDTKTRDAAITANGPTVVDNGDQTYAIYEPDGAGGVVVKVGKSANDSIPTT